MKIFLLGFNLEKKTLIIAMKQYAPVIFLRKHDFFSVL
jgi:hypothetical protein